MHFVQSCRPLSCLHSGELVLTPSFPSCASFHPRARAKGTSAPLDAGCSMLSAGCLMQGAFAAHLHLLVDSSSPIPYHRMLGAACWVLHAGGWMLGAGCWDQGACAAHLYLLVELLGCSWMVFPPAQQGHQSANSPNAPSPTILEMCPWMMWHHWMMRHHFADVPPSPGMTFFFPSSSRQDPLQWSFYFAPVVGWAPLLCWPCCAI